MITADDLGLNFFDPHGPYTPDVNQIAGFPEKPTKPADVPIAYPMMGRPTEATAKRVTATISRELPPLATNTASATTMPLPAGKIVFSEPKTAFAFLGYGGDIGFRRLTVTGSSD